MTQATALETASRESPIGRGSGPVLPFFLLTFAFTWVAWSAATGIPARGASGAFGLSILRGPLVLVGVFGPAIVALTLTARTDGRAGTWALLRRVGRWRVDATSYLFAAGYMVVIKLGAALVHRVVTGAWPRFGETRWFLMAIAVMVSTGVQAGEEVGWRGYALSRLAARLGLARASILLGVIWAAWHLPLFFFALGSDTYGQSFPMYLLEVTALSVAMAWLYWRTAGSLLLVMLMHAAINNTKDIVPSVVSAGWHPLSLSGSLVGWLTGGLLWIGAAFFLFQMRGAKLWQTRS